MNANAGTGSVSYPLSEEGLAQALLPPFVAEKIRRIAAEYRIERFQVEKQTVQGERVTLWCEGIYVLWFYQSGSSAWAQVDGAYTTFERIEGALLPAPTSPEEVWWLRLAGESEPYVLEVSCLTLHWGKRKGFTDERVSARTLARASRPASVERDTGADGAAHRPPAYRAAPVRGARNV